MKILLTVTVLSLSWLPDCNAFSLCRSLDKHMVISLGILSQPKYRLSTYTVGQDSLAWLTRPALQSESNQLRWEPYSLTLLQHPPPKSQFTGVHCSQVFHLETQLFCRIIFSGMPVLRMMHSSLTWLAIQPTHWQLSTRWHRWLHQVVSTGSVFELAIFMGLAFTPTSTNSKHPKNHNNYLPKASKQSTKALKFWLVGITLKTVLTQSKNTQFW